MQPVPSTPLTTEEIPVERAPSASATREHARPLESGSTGLPVPSPSTRSRVSRIELARKNAVLTILGSVFVAMLALFIVEQLSPGLFAGLRNVSTQGGRGVSGTTKTSSTQTTRPPPTATGAPVLFSLDPTSASSGASVTITGNDLFSSDHVVVARFDGKVSTTRCPSTHRCVAVVPTLPSGSGAVTVRVTTDAGQSNALTFQYT
ncbi:MAG TPA: IPT/TIG domain-containing protein [Acidimicrobiales bacterium]|nr:IPT/TIG domain-containing protein [Acidimicrobiales bacterium]